MNVIIFYSHSELKSQATEIAQRFNFILQEPYDVNLAPPQFLNLTPEGLMLHSPAMKPWHIDFLSAEKNYRRLHGGGFKETLARACGIKRNQILPTIVDLTAGFAKDAFVLACLGCDITLVERHPIIAALLDDGLKRLYADPEASRHFHLKLYFEDAEHFLKHSLTSLPDIVYIDPMHPQRTKSANVKKDMQILQQWIPPEEHPENLLNLSLKYAKKRVVLKWPRKSPAINSIKKPDFTYEENTVRFDVYYSHLLNNVTIRSS